MKLKKNKNLDFFKETSLNNILRVLLSSFLMISFFYITPVFLNFAKYDVKIIKINIKKYDHQI